MERTMYSLVMTDYSTGPTPGASIAIDPTVLLLRIAGARDKGALAQLFAHFGPRVKSMMLKLGAGDALAEDLVQETFLSVWRKAHLYSADRGAAATWIFTIARNLRIDQVRRQSNKPYEDVEAISLESDAPIASATLEQGEVIARVSEALKTLPAEQQEVVRLSFLHDLPHAQIAERVGIPLGTVKSRLRLAYDRLRPMLEDLH
jgi:RNA polymerase sigma-70 factor, ECF subfamily